MALHLKKNPESLLPDVVVVNKVKEFYLIYDLSYPNSNLFILRRFFMGSGYEFSVLRQN